MDGRVRVGMACVAAALALAAAGCDTPGEAQVTVVAGDVHRPVTGPAGSPTVRISENPEKPRPTATPSPTPTPVLDLAAWAEAPSSLGTPAPAVSAAAAIVVDEASGAMLFGKDEHQRLGPASLTKIATAILALEAGDLDRVVDVEFDPAELRRSTLMGLQAGDQFTMRDLLYGLMLPSGNDAALAIGRALAGSDSAFVQDMNDLAARLGLADTHFVNPHGLGRPGHYSSAHDLATLARFAMAMPEFQPLAATRGWTAHGSRVLSMWNLNPMLGRYPGADGVKTGYTRTSGKTLVVSATRDGRRVYVVLLHAPDRERDADALLDWAFANHTWP